MNREIDDNTIALIIDQLEMVRARSALYFDDEIPAVVNFLHGFGAACEILGATSTNLAIQESVFIEHGWNPSSLLAIDQMKAKGFSASDIAFELLTMTIDNWKAQISKSQ
jgi:hypothetical protein